MHLAFLLLLLLCVSECVNVCVFRTLSIYVFQLCMQSPYKCVHILYIIRMTLCIVIPGAEPSVLHRAPVSCASSHRCDRDEFMRPPAPHRLTEQEEGDKNAELASE